MGALEDERWMADQSMDEVELCHDLLHDNKLTLR